MKRLLICLLILPFVLLSKAHAAVATFDDFALTVPPAQNYTGPGNGQFYNGSDGAGGFTSGGVNFANSFTDFGGGFAAWDGWSVSNTTDTTASGLGNQYSAYTGGANSGSNYGVYYEPFTLAPTVSFDSAQPAIIQGAYFTNSTYAALSMLNGDGFAKKFGGDSGDDPDWLLLTITGIGGSGSRAELYLADYRFTDNSQDYILDAWTWVDLSVLGAVTGLQFDLSSSDVGQFGMNTPAYFAMDDLGYNPVPIPGAVWLLASGLVGLVGVRRRMRRK